MAAFLTKKVRSISKLAVLFSFSSVQDSQDFQFYPQITNLIREPSHGNSFNSSKMSDTTSDSSSNDFSTNLPSSLATDKSKISFSSIVPSYIFPLTSDIYRHFSSCVTTPLYP